MAGALGGMTVLALRKMLPGLSLSAAVRHGRALHTAAGAAGIASPLRKAHFYAQVAHESDDLAALVEYPHKRAVRGCWLCDLGEFPHAAGAQYEGRVALGNTQPGDGERFKGRGYLMLTGRDNYARAGAALGLPLLERPELAAEPEHAARIAAWFWRRRGLNALADANDLEGITRRINGGLNGLADRRAKFVAAAAALGV